MRLDHIKITLDSPYLGHKSTVVLTLQNHSSILNSTTGTAYLGQGVGVYTLHNDQYVRGSL